MITIIAIGCDNSGTYIYTYILYILHILYGEYVDIYIYIL